MDVTGFVRWAAADDTPARVDKLDYAIAGAVLLAGLLVLVLALRFALAYHVRVIRAMTRIALSGQPVTGVSDDSLAPGGGSVTTLSAEGGLGIQVPETVVAGSPASFVAQGYDAGATLSWVAEDGSPSSGSGGSFETTFDEPGPTTIELSSAADGGGGSAVVSVDVADPEPEEDEGDAGRSRISFPFAVRGWARFAVLIFGVAVIGALMAIGRISTDGGVGLLGALLGVGATTATNPEAGPKEPEPEPRPPRPRPKPKPGPGPGPRPHRKPHRR